uniref:Uncharacterized protein n=1 Tax=Rhizophora mucronata TaxID=61149 RepID=A0A2P2PST3_RHIMU
MTVGKEKPKCFSLIADFAVLSLLS